VLREFFGRQVDLDPESWDDALGSDLHAVAVAISAVIGRGAVREMGFDSSTYDVERMRKTLTEALTSDFNGLKVVIAEGECQLERQRRIKPWIASLLKKGERVVRVKYGVDEDVCNGDHACIRLSGCPTLTLKDNPDPLKVDPVATVIDGCVGCGLCGENAHAATLCPSFYRAEVVQNPKWHERLLHSLRGAVVRALQPA